MIAQARRFQRLIGPKAWSKQRRAWGVSVIASLFEAVSLAVMLPVMTMVLGMESFALGPFLFTRDLVLVGAVLFYMLGLVLRAASLRYTARATLAVGYKFAADLFERVLKQSQLWHSRHHSGELRTIVLQDAQDLMSLVSLPLGRMLAQGALVICVCAVMVFVKPVETLVTALVLASCYSAVFLITRRRLQGITAEQVGHHSKRNRVSTDALNAIREVRLGRLELAFASAFAGASASIAQSSGDRTVLADLPKLVMEGALFGLCLMVLLGLSGGPLGADNEALAGLMVFALAALKLVPMVHALYASFSTLRGANPLLEKLETFQLQLEPEIVELPYPAPTLGFALEDMTFTHEGAVAPLFSGFCLALKPGETVAITGPSGVGKSSLIDLISGLLIPQAGGVIVGGVLLTAAHARQWQRYLSYCPQRPILFDLDVVGNVLNGTPRDEQRLQQALHIACLDQLPLALEGAPIGEMGKRLSGGQVQRIGLARALYVGAPVLILDEPTSNLDSQTAQQFLDRLFAARGEQMIIIVTHDPKVVTRCDRELALS